MEGASSYWKEHFNLHGYLSLAYGDLDPGALGPTGDEITLGIPEEGTTDYRIAALQLRYDSGTRHAAVLQLSHRKLGDSPLSDIESAVELDWLFYELDLTDSTRVRLGRFPAMIGIFNEYRDVGVLLPFFRPSFIFYREGSLFSETIDGATVIHRAFQDSRWPLEVAVHYGGFDVIEQPVSGLIEGLTEIAVDDALGFQAWLTTPVENLRVGLGGQRWSLPPESSFVQDESTWESWYLSLDSSFGRWVLRAEYRLLSSPIDVPPAFVDSRADADNYYWQVGFQPWEKLRFFVQSEAIEVVQEGPALVESFRYTNRSDDGVSAVYAPRPDVVLKAEYHEVTSGNIGAEPVFLPEGPRFRFFTTDTESSYGLLSLSLSF